ncbi:MAG: hypothetical protein GXO07_02560 [Crenarchaeota archaeon]|nr:hypothetical protein [Thermoproteota archaeon]
MIGSLWLAWALWLLFPPLAVLALPDKCVDKPAAFALALILLLFPLLSWAYVGMEILNCQSLG